MNKFPVTFLCSIIISIFVQGQSHQPRPSRTEAINKANDFKKVGKNYFWLPTLNDSGSLQMVRLRPINKDSLNPKSIISFLNKTDLGNATSHKIYLELVKTSNDTIYLKIKNSFFLTQSIGTTGAMLYLAAVTYNLTELKKINYVKLDFEEGDHAVPGTYSRDLFIDR